MSNKKESFKEKAAKAKGKVATNKVPEVIEEAASTKKPKKELHLEIEEVAIHNGNTTTYVPGKVISTDSEIKTTIENTIVKTKEYCKTGGITPNTPIQHEPLFQHRWIIRFPKEEYSIQEWQLSRCSAVSNAHDMTLTFVNYVGPSVTQPLAELEDKKTFKNRIKSWLKKEPLVKFTIEILDPTGVAVSKYNVSANDYDITYLTNLDYASGEVSYSSITLKKPKIKLIF